MSELFQAQIIAVFLIGLRIAPTLAFAPPFTLLRVPLLIRVILGLGLSAWLVASHPEETTARLIDSESIAMAFASELVLGIALALSLQIAFAALMMAGRTIDIQAGFGLALLIDPTSRTQTPLTGMLFAYAAGAIFFTTNGPLELFAVWSSSVERMPLASAFASPDLAPLLTYISAVFFLALGLAGLLLLALFLIDMTVAFMSRTLPQMNVLLLGFQVKTLAVLALLPVTFALSGSLFLRLVRLAIDAAPRLI